MFGGWDVSMFAKNLTNRPREPGFTATYRF
jgi:hypothetical protein